MKMTPSSMLPRLIFQSQGIESLSPGLARFREGLPWDIAPDPRNPEKVEPPNPDGTAANLAGLCIQPVTSRMIPAKCERLVSQFASQSFNDSTHTCEYAGIFIGTV